MVNNNEYTNINLGVTPKDKEILQRLADKERLKLSSFIRNFLVRNLIEKNEVTQ